MSKLKSETKILKELKKANVQWMVNHEGTTDGRRTSTVVLCVDDMLFTGKAETSKKDQFNKNKGRAIALGRAYKALRKKEVSIYNAQDRDEIMKYMVDIQIN